MKILDADTTAQALPFEQLIPALRERFSADTSVPPRQIHAIPGTDGGPALTSLIMPAWVPGLAYGVKTVNVAPANTARGLAAVHAVYILFDAMTGVPSACLDGSVLTARRTVAASALAASFLARADASRLLIVGAGTIASLLAPAYATVRPLQDVVVWARRQQQAAALAARLRRQGFNARAGGALNAEVAQADIISCATLSNQPLVEGRYLQAGSHLDLIGGFTPEMREADNDCFGNGARIWVDTDEALQKSGDLLTPVQTGILQPEAIQGTLTSLCRGHSRGRESDHERTVFKSVGTALEDLAAAMLAVTTT